MAFGNPSNNSLSTLGSLCSSGGGGSETTLRAGCANSGSATDVALWDNGWWTPTVGTFWDSRIGANANNYNDGFNFSEERTTGDAAQVGSSSRPRGDTKRYDMDLNGDTNAFPVITITGIINDTAGAGGTTYNVGDWCGGDSNSATCVATIAEGFD